VINGIEINLAAGSSSCDLCIKSKIICKPLPKDSKDCTENWEKSYILMFRGCQEIKQLVRNYTMFISSMISQENQCYIWWEPRTKSFKNTSSMKLCYFVKGILFSDHGGEGAGREFQWKQGMKHRLTVRDTPNSNGGMLLYTPTTWKIPHIHASYWIKYPIRWSIKRSLIDIQTWMGKLLEPLQF
jgi:hypothetical protein